jgi:hypothetical protein
MKIMNKEVEVEVEVEDSKKWIWGGDARQLMLRHGSGERILMRRADGIAAPPAWEPVIRPKSYGTYEIPQ